MHDETWKIPGRFDRKLVLDLFYGKICDFYPITYFQNNLSYYNFVTITFRNFNETLIDQQYLRFTTSKPLLTNKGK